tara:strand:- start:22927 stop:23673 length:747 start_codon:yes stop_codon:yes gene_type:complete
MNNLNWLTPEVIKILQRNKVLKSVVQGELKHELVNNEIISEEEKSKQLNLLWKEQNITDQSAFEEWIKKNFLSKEALEDIIYTQIKSINYSQREFKNKIEGRFLERKSKLDQATYSLIRVDNPYLAKELYLRLIEKESDFSEVANEFSQGPENKTGGIIGPAPIGNAHPVLADTLSRSKVGEIKGPIQIGKVFLIVRLESMNTSVLDEKMKKIISLELLGLKIEKDTENKLEEILAKIEKNKVLESNL